MRMGWPCANLAGGRAVRGCHKDRILLAFTQQSQGTLNVLWGVHTTKNSPAHERYWGTTHLLPLPPGSLESHLFTSSQAEWMGTKEHASSPACDQWQASISRWTWAGVRGASLLHPLDLILHYTSLASAGLLWIKDLGGDHSQNSRGDPLLGAWQERLCGPPSVDSATLLRVPLPVSASHFCFRISSSPLGFFCFVIYSLYMKCI